MLNLTENLPRKRKRFNPYQILVWAVYTAIAIPTLAFAVFSMHWVVIFHATEGSGTDLPWWDVPVFIMGTLFWIALAYGCVVGLYLGVRGVVRGINYLNVKADEYREVSD